MQGKTHIALGVAAALLVTRPETAPGVLTAVTGGAIGGWAVDADYKAREMPRWEAALGVLVIGGFLGLDISLGGEMCRYAIHHWETSTWGALGAILLWALLAHVTSHRGFTHSFLGMAVLSGAVYVLCRPAALPLLAGYASHLLADFCNKRGIQLFFPLPWRGALGLCKSANRGVNAVLFCGSIVLDGLVGGGLLLMAIL